MTKEEELQQVAREIEACSACKVGTKGKAVPGEGNPDAKIVFVGEAPGRQEAVTGKPFIGKSGQLLRTAIRSSGLSEDAVFITSVGKYLPTAGTPSASQIAHGTLHLQKQLAIIKPKVIVLLGAVAVKGVLGEKLSIASLHGKICEKEGVAYFITFHPAAGLRFPPLRHLFLQDFSTLQSYLHNNGLLFHKSY